MQCRPTNLKSPIVGTGMESEISQVMGRVTYAPSDGDITAQVPMQIE